MRKIKDTADYRETVVWSCCIFAGGLTAGISTGSLWIGLLGAAFGFSVGLVIANQIWSIWLCGPRSDEFRDIVRNFDNYNLPKRHMRLVVGEREFRLYCQELADRSCVTYLELPWEHWREDLNKGELKDRLTDISNDIEETDTMLRVRAPEGTEQVLQLIYCVLRQADADLDNLELTSNLALQHLYPSLRGS